MKTYRQNLAMLSAVIAFGCNQKKSEEVTETDQKTEVIQQHPAEDTITNTDTATTQDSKTIEGTVLEIMKGKDGYTAKVETADKDIYFATISHSNLTDHEQYKSVKVGDMLKITGDSWESEGEKQLTVREIH